MAGIHIADIESAINFWRDRSPSADGVTLTAELRALAEVYALMALHRQDDADEPGLAPSAQPQAGRGRPAPDRSRCCD